MVVCENLKIIQTLIDEAVENNIDVSCLKDGYHSYKDYYLMRLLYNALLFNEWGLHNKYDVHKSKYHYNGEKCFDGTWFIVAANTPKGQITNHYELTYWTLFSDVPSVEKAKYKWDGHTSNDLKNRLFKLLNYKEYIN